VVSKLYLQRLFGIKTGEFRTVGLFLLHNFLLGIGGILVYVAANVLLLEHDPERSLPLGYIAGTLAMMAVGKGYTYFEHHLLLRKLVVRVLLAVLVLTGVVGVLVVVGHSVAAAVAIIAGYRIIYLLTSLEFWGVSAVVFDVRQSKRLFSVISAGDMPAKALGALLAALLHGTAQLPVLLGVAFGAYVGAWLVLRVTLGTHVVEAAKRPVRLVRRPQPQLLRQLFGGSELVFSMCLSMTAIAAVLTGVEYLFFLNVKHKFHSSAAIMHSVGWVLGGTYLVAMVFKLLLSQRVLDRYGVQWSLRLLPVVALGCLGAFGGIQWGGMTTSGVLLAFFCGLYLLLEVLRRTVFDPVFLVLFQSLAPLQRLAAHTLSKGFYEPLGMGLTGLLFFGLYKANHLEGASPYLWMGALLVALLLLLRRTYLSYLAELREGIGRRFATTAELALPEAARHVVLEQLASPRPTEVLSALVWLTDHEPVALVPQLPTLLRHPDERVRLAAITSPAATTLPAETLMNLALHDPATGVREVAAERLANVAPEPADLHALLAGADLAARQGAIRGCLLAGLEPEAARRSLTALLAEAQPEAQQAALRLLRFFPLEAQQALVASSLLSTRPGVTQAALAALGTLSDTRLANYLMAALPDRQHWLLAADSLVALGPGSVPLVRAELAQAPDEVLTYRLATVLERVSTPTSQEALLELASTPRLLARAIALRALRRAELPPADASLIEQLLNQEFALAARLLRGAIALPALRTTLDYELRQLYQRVFGLLAQRYDPEAVATAQRNVAHTTRERQATALEILDNLVPHHIYRGLQALLDDTPLPTKAALLTSLATPGRKATLAAAPLPADDVTLPTFLLRAGPASYTTWTLGLALHQWQPTDAAADTLLLPYLASTDELLRECALVAALALAAHRQQPLSTLFPHLPMSHFPVAAAARISALERVEVLKNTALFAHTPENVLSSVVPIMNEVTFHEGQEIFAKGDVGNSLFIVFDGQVGIFNGTQHLATFGPGDFFGELALLDAEPRSATAVPLSEVVAFRIDQEDFYDVMEERPEVLRNILRMLCQRIRRQNEKMQELAG